METKNCDVLYWSYFVYVLKQTVGNCNGCLLLYLVYLSSSKTKNISYNECYKYSTYRTVVKLTELKLKEKINLYGNITFLIEKGKSINEAEIISTYGGVK